MPKCTSMGLNAMHAFIFSIVYYCTIIITTCIHMYCTCTVCVLLLCSLHYFMVKVVIIFNRKLSFSNVTTSNTVKLL